MNSTPNTTPVAKEAPRPQSIGLVSVPPYHVQGISVAGEETVVQLPELDICFDVGRCPRFALTSNYIALTHGHMDHAAGLSYYFSQRQFQGMGTGTVVCPPALEQPIHNLMRAWIDIEAQKTPYNVIPLAADAEIEIKNNIFLRAFATKHTSPSMGYIVLERRNKLRADLVGMQQEQLMQLKAQGQVITQTVEVPLVCCTGDTMWGPHFDRPDVLNAKILITECTFLEPGHKARALIGQHLHLDDVVRLLAISKAEAVILTHFSRRTHISDVRKEVQAAIPADQRSRVHLLMDHRPRSPRTPAPGSAATPNPENPGVVGADEIKHEK